MSVQKIATTTNGTDTLYIAIFLFDLSEIGTIPHARTSALPTGKTFEKNAFSSVDGPMTCNLVNN